MVKNSKTDDGEINLIELMFILWDGKWKIAIAAIISLIAVIGYQLTQKDNFTAITEVKPMTTLIENKYSAFNNLITSINNLINDNDTGKIPSTSNHFDVIPKITKERFLNKYIDILNDRLLIESGIRKFNLLEKSQYSDEQEYNEAIIRLASSVKILTPLIEEKKSKTHNSYHTIEFVYDDEEKWISVLKYIDEALNQLVKKNLLKEYNEVLLSLSEQQKYALEDITIQISNNLIDYERNISDHLAYLKEQAEIARKLGIAKNTIEVQTFGNQNALLSNVKTDSPFYYRGYEAIEKEIELTESRINKKAFIKGLFELEKKKREIEQDKTIERTKVIINSTLLSDDLDFSAASIDTVTTKFEYKDNKKARAIAIVIGLIVGGFYVIVSSATKSYKAISKKTN